MGQALFVLIATDSPERNLEHSNGQQSTNKTDQTDIGSSINQRSPSPGDIM